MSKIVWIDKSLESIPQLELTKVALDFFVKNVKARHKYTKAEKIGLARYFEEEIMEPSFDFNQTS